MSKRDTRSGSNIPTTRPVEAGASTYGGLGAASVNRREFLRGVGRGSLALLLGGGVGALALRGGECTGGALCRGCAESSTCGLPDAVSLRRTERAKQGWTDGGQAEEAN